MISLSKQPSTIRQAICGLSSWQPIHSSLPFITSNNTYGVLLPTMTVHHSQQAIQPVLCLLPQQSHWSSHQVNRDYNSLQIHSHQLYGHTGSLGNSTICMLNCFEKPLICICIYKNMQPTALCPQKKNNIHSQNGSTSHTSMAILYGFVFSTLQLKKLWEMSR